MHKLKHSIHPIQLLNQIHNTLYPALGRIRPDKIRAVESFNQQIHLKFITHIQQLLPGIQLWHG